MAHELTMLMRGENRRLIITIPPRHLKSICTSVALPAFILGHDPTRKIICVSYLQELAVKHANDCRTVMNSDWYRRAFPGTKVDPGKNTETEVMTTQRGFRLSTSVGGTLTGRGGNLIIIDDPIKPTDAMSDTTRERLVQWCGTTLLSRLDDKERDAIILVMQRLHVGDLAGHFLTQGGWQNLNLPAIAEIEERIEIGPGRYHTRKVGELLHPARGSSSTTRRATARRALACCRASSVRLVGRSGPPPRCLTHPDHRWAVRVLDLEPVPGRPRAIGGAQPLRYDALKAQLAGKSQRRPLYAG
jgi:hypothetical protein